MSSDLSGLSTKAEPAEVAQTKAQPLGSKRKAAWIVPGVLATFLLVAAGAWVTRQRGSTGGEHQSQAPAQSLSALRTEAGRDRLFIDQMTWIEVRDAVRAGAKKVILAAGGIEQNGPHLVTGKHNYILHVTLPLIAKKLGGTLIAPIVPFSPPDDPEGDYHPGSMDLTEEVFASLLVELAENLKKSGFETILLMGESYGNQEGLRTVAERLSKEWQGSPTRVLNIKEYYDNDRWQKWLVERGIHEVSEGIHDDVRNSSLLAVYDPDTLRAQQRQQAGRFSINGVQLEPLDKTIALGNALAEYQATTVVDAVRRALAAPPQPGAKP